MILMGFLVVLAVCVWQIVKPQADVLTAVGLVLFVIVTITVLAHNPWSMP